MSLKGLNKLHALTDALKNAPKKLEKIVSQETKALAPVFDADREKQFDKGRSPYGEKWKKRKDDLKHPLLNKTGRLKNSFKTVTKGTTMSFSNKAPYAKFVDAERQTLPDATRGLPKKWDKELKRRVLKRVKKELI